MLGEHATNSTPARVLTRASLRKSEATWPGIGYDGLLAVDGWCLLLGVGILMSVATHRQLNKS